MGFHQGDQNTHNPSYPDLQRDAPTIATFSNTSTYFRILQIFNPGKMQATLAFTARPLAVRRSAAQTSARTTLVVRAENKEARTRYVWYS
jgi:hypothetical protein